MQLNNPMKHCSRCGGTIKLQIPQGDNRERHVCSECEHIHYQNPRIIAGCLAVTGDKVLLCQRGIEPQKGFWTLPAGFMENGETTQAAAMRETREEALAHVEDLELYTLTSITHISQVQLIYRCQLVGDNYGVGEESVAVNLFAEHEIPWDELAFPTIRHALEHYFSDRKKGVFQFRHMDL